MATKRVYKKIKHTDNRNTAINVPDQKQENKTIYKKNDTSSRSAESILRREFRRAHAKK